MRLVLCSLVLNEMEWLPRLYEQHRYWPCSVAWIFVEAADRVYAEVNPDMVSQGGLSVDGTSAYLHTIAEINPKVTYVPYGITGVSRMEDPAQGKCSARSAYLAAAAQHNPTHIYVLDADEFYTREHQRAISMMMAASDPEYTAFMFGQRHIWRPASVASQPLLSQEVVGGYWRIPHCRGWRWFPGMRHLKNHNWPEDHLGNLLNARTNRFNRASGSPECVHLGYASGLEGRAAKHRYYQARGEGRTDRRGWYVKCRQAYEEWKPGDKLPHGAQVRAYDGPVPECFQHLAS